SYSLGAFDLDALPDGNLATVTFTYTSKDDQGLESAAQTATITITGTNDNPTLTAGSIAATEDQLEAGYTVDAATSNLLTGAADIDDVNSSLIVGQVNGSAINVGSAIPVTLSYTDADGLAQTQAINLTVNANGSYSLGAFDLDALPIGNSAIATFTYTSMDDQGLESPPQTVTIDITGTNDAPVNAVSGIQTIAEDTLLTILGNSVSDADDSELTLQLSVSQGVLSVNPIGTATITAGGNSTNTITLFGSKTDINATMASIEYQGNLNYHGPDSLVITSTDASAASATSSVSINVYAVNDLPVGDVIISGTELEGQTLSLDAQTVQDVDGLGVFSYQWLRDGEVIEGANETSYILVTADLGAHISVNVSYVDGDGTGQTVSSDLTGPISGDASNNSSSETGAGNTLDDLALREVTNEDRGSDSTNKETLELALKVDALTLASAQDDGLSALSNIGINASPYDENETDARVDGRGNSYDGKSVVSKFIDLRLELLNQIDGNVVDEIDDVQFVSYSSYAALADELYQLGKDLDDDADDKKFLGKKTTEVSVGLSMSLTAGVVSWVMRGGSLLASLISVAPLWQQVDPLPILGAGTKSLKNDTDDDEKTDEESNDSPELENYFDSDWRKER
ncbi:MAG: VCBS domain-containing protein, partial [Pseudomonadales bacterium]|nr:VCBS domain-containing protein [Pseudomonadales bacterium]